MRKYLLIFLFFLFIPVNTFALEYPQFNSTNVIVYDKTDNNILYQKDSEQVHSIASLTKIVTTIVSIENIENLDESVVITPQIINSVDPIASKAGLRSGDVVTYRDLLYASILPSGADATNALAILSSGSIENFVEKMNNFVSSLNLTNTHFVNVTGLDDYNHYSSADDILKILCYSLDNEIFYKVFTTKSYTLSNGLTVYSTLYKYNGDDVANIIGSKTGFTGDAGYCIATLSNTDGHEIVAIFLGANNIGSYYYNIIDSMNLIEFINNNYSNKILLNSNSKLLSLNVQLSKISSYDVYSNNEISKFLPNDFDKNMFSYKYDGIKNINYKYKNGDKLGVITYFYGDNILLTEDVILDQNIEISYIKIIKNYIVYEVICLISIILIIIISILIHNKKKKENVIV